MYSKIPQQIISIEGEDISLRPFSPVLENNNSVTVSDIQQNGKKFPVETKGIIKLCGLIPIKTVSVKTYPASSVIPCGNLIGIKLNTKGVAVVATDSFISNGTECSPALKSGIKPGDVIVSANGKVVNTIEELTEIVKSSKTLTLKLQREDKIIEIKLIPEFDSESGTNKLGIWVRDSYAGIGTLTFFRCEDRKYAALGHGLTDAETGLMYPASGGELTAASVISVVKSKKGAPGELCGILNVTLAPLGTLDFNSSIGVSGTLNDTAFATQEPCTLCPRSEIKIGKASILSCVGGTEVKEYEIELERIVDSGKGASKDMLIRVTDKELLDKTGGIVQGMSGSPIIQDGKLVGAVTHVFVNDPTRGYGIFADKMLE